MEHVPAVSACGNYDILQAGPSVWLRHRGEPVSALFPAPGDRWCVWQDREGSASLTAGSLQELVDNYADLKSPAEDEQENRE